jgi:hypothetical protein
MSRSPACPPEQEEISVPRYALLYPARPGKADDLVAALAAGGDPSPPPGAPNLLRSTTVFRHGDDVVRIFEIDGDIDLVVRVLAESKALHHMNRQLDGLLRVDYDLTDPDGVRRFFADNLMTTVTDRVLGAYAGSRSG